MFEAFDFWQTSRLSTAWSARSPWKLIGSICFIASSCNQKFQPRFCQIVLKSHYCLLLFMSSVSTVIPFALLCFVFVIRGALAASKKKSAFLWGWRMCVYWYVNREKDSIQFMTPFHRWTFNLSWQRHHQFKNDRM